MRRPLIKPANKPLEWTGHHKFTSVAKCSLPATQGQRQATEPQIREENSDNLWRWPLNNYSAEGFIFWLGIAIEYFSKPYLVCALSAYILNMGNTIGAALRL